MIFSKTRTLKEVADLIHAKYIGPDNHPIKGMNEIHKVKEGDLVYVDHPKYYNKAINSKANTIIINKIVDVSKSKALIISKNPFDDYNKIAKLIFPSYSPDEKILNQEIHPSATIYPNVWIGENVSIGANSVLYPGACIMENVTIGEHVSIGPNSVIGHYAFYYKEKENSQERMHSIGNVHIHDYVEIGALCTIDRGVSASTVIGFGSKLDNQVHIGHDTLIGERCIIASGVGVSGCTTVENEVKLWGQVGCSSNITIGAKANVLGQSGVTKDLEGGKTYFGTPCKESRQKFKELAAIQQLPEIIKNL